MIYVKDIIKLIEAIYLIVDDKKVNNNDAMVSEEKLNGMTISPDLFTWGPSATLWEDFPRYLSKKEFCNPYLVFKRFFDYLPLEVWRYRLTEIIDYAVSKSLDIAETDFNMVAMSEHLHKLLDAATLIEVREFRKNPNSSGS
jgi:hypothetical protein